MNLDRSRLATWTDAVTRDLEAYQRAYAASDFEAVQARLRKRRILEWLAGWQPRRLLEVGCGSEPLFVHYRGFESFVVVEPGATFAANARELAAGDSRIRVLEAAIESAVGHLDAGSFDCILLSGLLHEVVDCTPILEAARSLCAPDTRLHVNVPNARSVHRLLALEMGLIGDLRELSAKQRELQQPRTFDRDSLAALCTAHGFAVEESGSYFVKPFSHDQMASLMRQGFLDERMLDGLYGLVRHLPESGSEIYVHLRVHGPREETR